MPLFVVDPKNSITVDLDSTVVENGSVTWILLDLELPAEAIALGDVDGNCSTFVVFESPLWNRCSVCRLSIYKKHCCGGRGHVICLGETAPASQGSRHYVSYG